MNACMFVYEYDSYQDMCSFYDILFNVLPPTMANNFSHSAISRESIEEISCR